MPPIGDIAWAASPMQSRPGRYQRRSRSTRPLEQLESSTRSSSPRRGRSAKATSSTMRRATLRSLRALSSSKEPLRNDVGALPVVAAVDHHDHMCRYRYCPTAARLRPGCLAISHPKHVHRCAEILDRRDRQARKSWNGARRLRRRALLRITSSPSDVSRARPPFDRPLRSGRQPRSACSRWNDG